MSDGLILLVEKPLAERASLFYQGRLARYNGDQIILSSISKFEITLFALNASRTVINGLDSVSALNTGRGTVNADGSFLIELIPDDMVIVDSQRAYEKHRLMLVWEFDTPIRRGSRLVEFTIHNLRKVA